MDRRGRGRELRQFEGAGHEVRQRRGGRKADLDDVLHAPVAEQQRLGLDPPDRGGELPGQQLDEQQPGECRRVIGGELVERAVRTEQLPEGLGGDDLEDGLREVAGQLEGAGDEVRDVTVDQGVDVQVGGQQGVEFLRERGDTGAQHRGVEGDVDAGDRDERAASARGLRTRGGVSLQCLQPGEGSGHGVLLAGDVEVHDLQELARGFRDGADVLHHTVVVHAELVRSQRAEAVVGAAPVVARDEGVHGRAAGEDDVDDALELEDAGRRRE